MLVLDADLKEIRVWRYFVVSNIDFGWWKPEN